MTITWSVALLGILLSGAPGSVTAVQEADAEGRLVLSVRGDLQGNAIGALVTPDHKAVPDAPVLVRLLPESLNRNLETRTDSDGVFTAHIVELSTGVRAEGIELTASSGGATGRAVVPISDLALRLTQIPDSHDDVISLNGTWEFIPDPPEGFWRPDERESGWKRIQVPGHWVMQGFDAKTWTGGYRRRLAVPASWKGRKVILRFEGVHTGAEAWVNGSRVGYHDGGATPFEFDVSDAVLPGRRNLIHVRVREDTDSSYLDAMSMYAHFPLAGIYRDVSLFAVSPTHISRLQADTVLGPGDGEGMVKVDMSISNDSDKPVRNATAVVDLLPPGKRKRPAASRTVAVDIGARATRRITLQIRARDIRAWDLEHPVLYELQASLTDDAGSGSAVSRKIGFREVRVDGSLMLLNGVALKLKGANRHDAHPLMGRAITAEIARQDLDLMRACNMNAFRTSHYPPVRDVIEYASEVGLGVEEEAALCFVGIPWGPRPGYIPPVNWMSGLSPAKDPWFIPIIVQQVAEMVERDRSQPSVLWWSLSNESDWGPAMAWAMRWLRRTDSTRPVSGGGESDIAVYHNPTVMEHVREAEKHGRPVLGEEALAIFQGFGENDEQLYVDPGMRDLWVAPFISIWDEAVRSPAYLGVFTWAWGDDCFLVPGYGIEGGRYDYPRVQFEQGLYETPDRGVAGEPPWGVVDGWRRPRPEWFLHKKLFSPVRIAQEPLSRPSGGVIEVPVENRFLFTNLSEIDCRWRTGNVSGRFECDVPPSGKGIARIRLPEGARAGDALELSFHDSHGRELDAYRLPIGSETEPRPAMAPAPAPELREERTNLGGFLVRVVGRGFELAFAKSNGRLCRGIAGGRQALLEWPALHILRNDDASNPVPSQRSWILGKLDYKTVNDTVVVSMDGAYTDFAGGYVITIHGDGLVRMDYSFIWNGPDIAAREIGLRMAVPKWCDTLSWSRNAEFSGYPDDHIGRPSGSASAFPGGKSSVPPAHPWSQDGSPMGTNDFRSSKRHITFASLTDGEGAGVAVESDGSQTARACVSRQSVDLAVLDYYGGTRSSMIPVVWEPNYGSGRKLSRGDVVSDSVTLRLVGGSE